VRFGGLTAVNTLDLEIQPHEIVSLIGPNGAGKTTVFNAVTGIHEPTRGRIVFKGAEVCRPFHWRTAASLAFFGFVTGNILVFAANIEALWEAAVTAHYQYLKPFPWREAIASVFSYFTANPSAHLEWPLGIGIVVGAGGAYAVWRQSRRAPEIAARAGIARTFQNIRLFDQMTALDNVLLGMDTQLRSRFWHDALRLPLFWREHREAEERAMEMLRFVGLEPEAHRLAENLAYGLQRRLEIARALAMKPQLLLLDEPAAGMNPAETVELMQLIQRIRERGITVFLIEHHMRVVMGISDRIAVLDHGEKIAEGNPQEVRADQRVIAAYLGKRMRDE
jgi:ABC-type branched-subunit amino acid transport system ATPase component